jgi:UDP-N-acetylmuramoyl-tripeptide--D-alanyl-D-alanine ligase
MHAAVDALLDRLELHGKPIAKALYRRPVIAAARAWRRLLPGTCFIGVTGSAGKTTTKELIHAVLAQRHRCASNSDSNNQLYNIARTLLAVAPGTQYCVQELGADQPGGFPPMLRLLRPSVAVVVNIGKDHLRAFRSREAVALEKGHLVASLPPTGIAVLNLDDSHAAAMAQLTRARIVTFGLGEAAQFRGEVVDAAWPARLTLRVSHAGESVTIATRYCGAHQAQNVIAAIATACSLGATLSDAAAAIARCEPVLGRLSVQASGRGVTILRDDFKAPEWSLPAVWQFMSEARARRKIIVIGTLSDHLGSSTKLYRRHVRAALAAADHVVLVGEGAASRAARWSDFGPGRFHGFDTVREASLWMRDFAQPEDLILLKGSNHADHLARIALHMDREIGCWRRRCGRAIFCDRCRALARAAVP